jgi:hypothetical protein
MAKVRQVDNHSGSTNSDVTQSMQSHLSVIAKVAIGISLLSSLVLVITLFLVFAESEQGDYFQSIQATARNQDQLIIAMLIGGTLIILLAGLITWLITLYSSARVAGPLYRFAKNIEMEIESGPVAIIKLREEDGFQQLSSRLDQVVTEMNRHYGDQLLLVDRLEQSLTHNSADAGRYSQLLQQLKVEQSVVKYG